MSGYRESDQVEAARPDSGGVRGEQLDANHVAEQRLAERGGDPFECEHVGDQAAEAEAVRRSAEVLMKWDRATTEDRRGLRRVLLDRVGTEMARVHEAPNSPTFPDRLMERGLLGANDDRWNRIDESLLNDGDPRPALETYLHEYRHDEQRYEVLKSHGVLGHQVDLERSGRLEWAIQHYDSSEDARAYLDGDADRFAAEVSKRILEQRAELVERRGDRGESPGREIRGPGDEMAHLRLGEQRAPRG